MTVLVGSMLGRTLHDDWQESAQEACRGKTMRLRILRVALPLSMAVVAVVLAADIAYLMVGSLEQFPTAEQEDKVRRVTGAIAVLLITLEIALWFAHRNLHRASGRHLAERVVPPAG